MPDQPQPATPPKTEEPADPSVYGGQWGDGAQQKTPGPPPPDRPDKIETPPGKT
ncbi:hypothetical protein [Phenylobacterium sp.]|uniref:hypothetical protein n=1 Tax=Phenylobacterium sp. TaxID=1871053 RepID=UPI003563C620